jgi:hypothetical protein
VSAAVTDPKPRRPPQREAEKILADCRDLAIHRLVLSFSAMLDRVVDMLMERADRSLVPEETTRYLNARRMLSTERAAIMAAFERCLGERIDRRLAEDAAATKADFSKLDATKLTLIDTLAMDESVVTGNIRRNFENTCHEQLLMLNHGMAQLLGRPELETDGNPLAPAVVVDAFAEALRAASGEEAVKLTILRTLNQSELGDIGGIYADLNAHLVNQRVIAANWRPPSVGRPPGERARSPKRDVRGGVAPAPELDLMSLFQQLHGGPPAAAGQAAAYGAAAGQGAPARLADTENIPEWLLGLSLPADGSAVRPLPAPGPTVAQPEVRFLGMPDSQQVPFPELDPLAGAYPVPTGPLAPTASGYVPGTPIMATRALGEGLSRLQAGETEFALGEGTRVRFSGIPQGKHNVLRDLQDSELGQRVNQLESMTIELVAMLFDFVFETRDLPDGIKALLARLQIPVLKAAMLDGAFFAKKSHPARVLVNALAQAGLGWSSTMGYDDPLYRKIHDIVHAILDRFSDDLTIFEEQRTLLQEFLESEERAADANIQATADEIDETDRRELAPSVARRETEHRIETYPVPNFLASFLRGVWITRMEQIFRIAGESSEAWAQGLATIEDLVWSVQPKRTREDRRHLVALLPMLLKRIDEGIDGVAWPPEERDRFMENLVEAHAAAVKPGAIFEELPTEVVVEQAQAEAEQARAAGDEAAAARATERAEAMTKAEPAPPVEQPAPAITDDEYLDIAQHLARGTWIEFEDEDGQLSFARLAWVSPLRGTYLFTNRQGHKALSMTAEELAELFRTDRARRVEDEPLLDQALTSVLENLTDRAAARARPA